MADIALVKSNIEKMISQGAPERDIDAYISGEGVTVDQLKQDADPYRAAARKEIDGLKAKGVDTGVGLTRQAIQGITFNAADDIIAGALTPLEMIKQGTWDPREGYKHAKAREDLILEDSREKNGMLGSAAEIVGGIGSGAGLARAGASFGRGLTSTSGLGARSGASAADGLVFGTLAGGMEGNSLAERGSNALQGGALGGVIGGAAVPALSLAGAAASPIISNISARANPERFARSQVARGLSESGMTPQQVAGDVSRAAREGQGMFTLADAMGNSGQRMLASTARAPGQARTDVVNFLDQRQAGQGRRVAGALDEGFGTNGQTSAQVESAMSAARKADADAAYGAVRRDAQPVDVSGVLARIDETLAPYGVGQNVSANDTAASSLTSLRRRLADGDQTANDFNLLQRVRGDLADEIQQAMQSGAGNKARLLGGALRELDTALENSSTGFRDANRNFAQASRDIDAVGLGRTAALRGRTENTIPQFQAQSPRGQQGYRAGYVDPLIENAQGAAYGANKARPLTSDAFADEAAIMAPGNDLMQRRIGRENTMFQTRQAATGNSKTTENLADDAAMGVDPGLIGQILTGNITGAVRSLIASGSNALSGNTAAVRQEVANLLMSRGQNMNPAALQQILDETMRRLERVSRLARQAGRGASAGVAVAPTALDQR